ncbi:DUF4405 domain-containing protein [Flavilitoribacter nigricans]|uniref:Uncharacterized protein n=1 Tax=Flavilitoribacter nigricans (strain ATCC 23147 / DSM 23189 / NBRC 102662 / NCIMB 1420 / SS-2) TaxID=1122177 RepID=A0A2D0NH39_FLAN2|nr:DUF4405 domain-containing protein [Flavilitoribacter nigricans]PHN07700.1 hypothetical protein CRP01_06260 [Flavilitoribacter nigricans DSM 23189 = NBRC 102662]
MNRRLLGNILLSTVLILTISGAVMYFIPFKKTVASLHTVFAILFCAGILLHLLNNKIPLGNYVSGRRQTRWRKYQSPLIFGMTLLLVLGLMLDLPGLNAIYDWGNSLRNRQLGKSETSFDYEVIELEQKQGDHQIKVELQQGAAFQYPMFALWLEDSLGNYLETLYISRVISTSTYDFGIKLGRRWKPAVVRRPEGLPYWAHQRGIQASDGLYIPLDGAPDLDAVSGATPVGNFVIHTRTTLQSGKKYRILLELNQSYDWNEYFTKTSFPDDPIYSGSGRVGQPSLVYTAEIGQQACGEKRHFLLKLTGYGHPSGKTGELFTALEKITTAKNIADRIILTVEREKTER